MSDKDPIFDLLAYKHHQNWFCFSACASGLFLIRSERNQWENAYQSILGENSISTLALAKAAITDDTWMILAGVPGAVLRAESNHLTWQVSHLPQPEPIITALSVSPSYVVDGIAFASTQEDGVFVTNNNGVTWINWNLGLIDIQTYALSVSPAFALDNQVFVGSSTGLYKSENRGRSWRPVELPIGYDAVLSLALSPAFGQDGIGFLGTENHGLLRTLNGGSTWQSIGTDATVGSVNKIILDPAFPDTPNLAALVDSRLHLSNNGGESWKYWIFEDMPDDFEITTFIAPEGFSHGATMWFGSSDGRVKSVRVDFNPFFHLSRHNL